MKLIFDKDEEGSMQDTIGVSSWEAQNGSISLELPEGFADMEEEKKKANYPYEGRPEIILEDEGTNTHITLQFMNKELKAADTLQAAAQVCELTKSAFPRYKTSPEYLLETQGVSVGWFLLYMDDMEREHIKAVFSVENRLALFTMTYPEADRCKGRTVFKYIVSSLKIKQGNKGVWR